MSATPTDPPLDHPVTADVVRIVSGVNIAPACIVLAFRPSLGTATVLTQTGAERTFSLDEYRLNVIRTGHY